MELFKCISLFCIVLYLVSENVLYANAQNCHLSTECLHNQCCVLDKSTNMGACKPMGGVAARCYVNQPYAYTRPTAMVTDFDMCPCSPGNICGPVASYNAVYGQNGFCTFGK